MGGAIGAIFVSVNVLVAPRLGSAATVSLVIAGQLIGAIMVDRLGLFDFALRGFVGRTPRWRGARVRRRLAGAFDLRPALSSPSRRPRLESRGMSAMSLRRDRPVDQSAPSGQTIKQNRFQKQNKTLKILKLLNIQRMYNVVLGSWNVAEKE